MCQTINRKTMNCKTLHKKLIFFVDEELPSNEMEKVKQHLSECNECALYFEDLKKTLEVISIERSKEKNPFFYTKLKAKMETREMIDTNLYKKPVLVSIIQPALFACILLIGIYAGLKIGQTTSKQFNTQRESQEFIPYLNDLHSEPIETFLFE